MLGPQKKDVCKLFIRLFSRFNPFLNLTKPHEHKKLKTSLVNKVATHIFCTEGVLIFISSLTLKVHNEGITGGIIMVRIMIQHNKKKQIS